MSLPNQDNMKLAILNCLVENDGELDTQGVYDYLRNIYTETTDEDLLITVNDNSTEIKFKNSARWAHLKLQENKFCCNVKDKGYDGTMKITDLGREYHEKYFHLWTPYYRSSFNKTQLALFDKIDEVKKNILPENIEAGLLRKLLERIKELKVYQSEFFMKKVFSEMDKTVFNIIATQNTKDHGIDLIGESRVCRCSNIVPAQVKHHEGKVSKEEIQAFKGSIIYTKPIIELYDELLMKSNIIRNVVIKSEKPSHGLFFSPYGFSSDAKSFACGLGEIDLINDDDILKICIDHKIGVKEEDGILKVDDDYFDYILNNIQGERIMPGFDKNIMFEPYNKKLD